MLIVLGLGILWFSGVCLAILDGRRKRIGMVAIVALVAAIVAVVALGMKVRLATYSLGTDEQGTEAIGFGFEPADGTSTTTTTNANAEG